MQGRMRVIGPHQLFFWPSRSRSRHDAKYNNKYVRLRGRPYIHTCRGRATRAPSVERTGVYWQYLPPRADSSDLGLLGELLWGQSSPKWDISGLGRRWTIVQNLTPLALSSPEKSVTVQTNKNKQKTVNDISTPCLSACVDYCLLWANPEPWQTNLNYSYCKAVANTVLSVLRVMVRMVVQTESRWFENAAFYNSLISTSVLGVKWTRHVIFSYVNLTGECSAPTEQITRLLIVSGAQTRFKNATKCSIWEKRLRDKLRQGIKFISAKSPIICLHHSCTKFCRCSIGLRIFLFVILLNKHAPYKTVRRRPVEPSARWYSAECRAE